MVKISVNQKTIDEGWEFDVEVKENDSFTKHKVTMNKGFYDVLGTKSTPEEVVRKSFEFLLEREPKEAILGEFNVEVIGKYFPEFKTELTKGL